VGEAANVSEGWLLDAGGLLDVEVDTEKSV